MLDADPVSGHGDPRAGVSATHNNLALRIGSAAVLAPLALAAAYLGGWPFAAFWVVAAAAVLWEWSKLVAGAVWHVGGIGYAGAMLVAPIVLRADAGFGFFAILLLFAIVWTTDILGYFAGRAIGGPKLMPAISPKKTWAGAIAGTLGAIVAALLVARGFGSAALFPVAAIAVLLSVMAQLGDLLEVMDQAPFRRQGREPHNSRPRRRHGPAGRILGGGARRGDDRGGARRIRQRRARAAGMVSA